MWSSLNKPTRQNISVTSKNLYLSRQWKTFCDISGADVVVSTIHKAKGREFDDVYMLVSDGYIKDSHLMRRYYVGITRAKNRLFIHTNGDYFNHLSTDRYFIDQQQYDMPEEIVLQLSHKDVYLGFFKKLKREVLALRGGDLLKLRQISSCMIH